MNYDTWEPFGEAIEFDVDFPSYVANFFVFTGQYFDSEIEEYYLRARQYNPQIARFTSRQATAG